MEFEANMSRTRHQRTITRYWILIGVFGCAFLFLITTMTRSVNEYDEGLILVGSTRVLAGDIPYRDFYANYGPAQFYALAALFKVFGPSIIIERLWDLLIRACTVLVVYLIVNTAWSKGTALFTAVLTTIWLSSFEYYAYPIFPCLLFSLLSLYFVIPLYEGRDTIAPLLLSGICVGITILFRHDVGIATALGNAFTLGFFHVMQRLEAPRKIRDLLGSATIYTAGIAVAFVPALALFLAVGAAHDILIDLIVIPSKTYARMRSLPFPSVIAIARDVIHLKMTIGQLVVYLPIAAVMLGASGALALARNRQSAMDVDEQALTSKRLWIVVALSVYSFLFFFKSWVRVALVHMALSIVPSLMLMAIWQSQARSRAAQILFGFGIAGLLLTSLPRTRDCLTHFVENLAWMDGAAPAKVGRAWSGDDGDCFPPLGLERLRCFHIARADQSAIRYIQERTAENENIFVGSTRHDKILENNVLFYFLSERPPATKWHHFDPGVQTTTEIQSEMVGELQTHPPRFVILSSEWDNIEEPNESARSSGVTILDQFIHKNYRSVARFGALTIMEVNEVEMDRRR